jgi:hypothetical protein
MAQPTVNISAPGSSTAIACTASGNAAPSPGNTLSGMGYQIDSGPINGFQSFNPNGGLWSCGLTPNDCPVVGNTYLLTIYAGDSSGNFNNTSTTFTRTS